MSIGNGNLFLATLNCFELPLANVRSAHISGKRDVRNLVYR